VTTEWGQFARFDRRVLSRQADPYKVWRARAEPLGGSEQSSAEGTYTTASTHAGDAANNDQSSCPYAVVDKFSNFAQSRFTA